MAIGSNSYDLSEVRTYG